MGIELEFNQKQDDDYIYILKNPYIQIINVAKDQKIRS